MKKIFFSLLFSFFLLSCTTTQKSSVLYKEYSRYDKSITKDNAIKVARDFFSPSLIGKNYQTDPDAISQLILKNYMVIEDSHHEKMNKQYGCLTINGYDEENAPLVLSLKYIQTNKHWLIDKIHIVFIDNVKHFSDSAKCPHEYPE
jgi:hypothetical protein